MAQHSPSVGVMLVFFLFITLSDGSKVEIEGSMGSSTFCSEFKGKVSWLTDEGCAILYGKSEGKSSQKCTIVFGTSTDHSKNSRIRLNFDFIYFDSCDVKLQINQSSSSDFKNSKDNEEMFMSGCDYHNPGPLYAQPKNFVLVTFNRASSILQGYNFRLNVSTTEKLPVTGTPLRVVIIVSFVCFVVVVSTAFLLLKYANRMSVKWSEEHREETMSRAINLYNTRESPEEESTMAYIEPGVGVRSNGRQATAHRSDRPEIAFIHGSGRVERFQPLMKNREDEGSNSERVDPSNLPQPELTSGRGGAPGEEPTHFYLTFLRDRQVSGRVTDPAASGTSDPSRGNTTDTAETASIGGLELPPSYEEALTMPLPSSMSEDGAFGDSRIAHPKTVDGAKTQDHSADPDRDLINLEDDSSNYLNIQGNLQLLDAAAAEGGEEEKADRKESSGHS